MWKARLVGYQRMSSEFKTSSDENAPIFHEVLADASIWKRIVSDNNAMALEAGIIACQDLVEYGGPNAGKRYELDAPHLSCMILWGRLVERQRLLTRALCCLGHVNL